MKRMNTAGRILAFSAILAALPLAISAQTTYHVDINAAGPGDGSAGDPFTTVQDAIDELIANGSDGDTIYIHPGLYPPTGSFQTNAQHTGPGTQRTHTNITALFNGLTLNNITVTGDPNDRPVFEGGIFFANDTHTGFTLENIEVHGRTTTNAEIAYLVNSFNQTGATVSGVPNLGRRDMTIRNCVFDGQNIGVHSGSPLTSTQGLRIYQLGGDFIFEDNVITRLTGNVAFSPTGAGSVSANDYNADPPRVPANVYIRRNQLISSTGAIDVRGYTNSNSFEATSKNPIMYVTDNVVSGVPPSTAPSGGAFKIFHAKEGYFYGNKISATAVTGNAYGDDPCNPGLDNRVRGAGIMFLNVGKLIIAGNEFIDCLQAICHDPHPAAGATTGQLTTNSALPADFQIIYNTFSFCDLAVYFPPLTRPGWYRTGTACGDWVEDATWNPAWNQPVVFRNNNFINNEFSILHQGQDAGTGNVVIDAAENFWGDESGPGPNDIVIEVIDPVVADTLVSATDPLPQLVLEDGDGDGLPDWREVLIYGTDPNNPDSSGDGIPDGFAVAVGLDPTINYQDNPTSLPTGVELADVTPDYTADTNGSGIADWYETTRGAAAAGLGDANNDGIRDNVDALIITGIVVGAPGFDLNKFNFNNLDLNLDGQVNNVDAIILINHFLGNIPVIPLPPTVD